MGLIDGDKLLQTGGFFHDIDGCEYWTKEDIDNAPTIDPSSLVKRGRWVDDKDGFHCSECKYKPQTDLNLAEEAILDSGLWYCGHCGARMKED